MQTRLLIFMTLLLSGFYSTSGQQLTIDNVTIISIEEGKLLKQKRVVVNNGKIERILNYRGRRGLKGKVIDGTGKYLCPGLADMHVHLPETDIQNFLEREVSAGVTTIRSMRGDQSHVELKKRIDLGLIVAPHLIISAPPLYATDSITPGMLRTALETYKRQGYDLIKILSVRDEIYFDSVMAVTKALRLKVAGHAPSNVPLLKIIRSGMSSIEHLDGYYALYKKDSSAFEEVLRETAAYNTFNCPTIDWYALTYGNNNEKTLLSREGIETIPSEMLDKWLNDLKIRNEQTASAKNRDSVANSLLKREQYLKTKLRILKKMDQANLLMLVSPDASGPFQVPGFSMIDEMEHYQRAGIKPEPIIRAATLNAARYMQDKSRGIIRKGAVANLVLLDKNPLEDVSHFRFISGTILNGKWFPANKNNF